MILDMLPVKDSVSAARVCQAWKEPALDRVWHKVDELVPLWRLIGQMTWGADGGQVRALQSYSESCSHGYFRHLKMTSRVRTGLATRSMLLGSGKCGSWTSKVGHGSYLSV